MWLTGIEPALLLVPQTSPTNQHSAQPPWELRVLHPIIPGFNGAQYYSCSVPLCWSPPIIRRIYTIFFVSLNEFYESRCWLENGHIIKSILPGITWHVVIIYNSNPEILMFKTIIDITLTINIWFRHHTTLSIVRNEKNQSI